MSVRPLPLVSGEIIESWNDPEIRSYFEDCYRLGTPPPSGLLMQAHHPAILRAWSRFWWGTFHGGVVDHRLKEILRMRIARLSKCTA
jgi:hypothetical protein